MQTKTLTVKVTTGYSGWGDGHVALPGPINRLLALAVHYDAACPATTTVGVSCDVPVYKQLLGLINRNTDLPLSQVTEVEVDLSGTPRSSPATRYQLVGGMLWVSVSICSNDLTDAVTVTAIVEV
jgi:hypothetical protein